MKFKMTPLEKKWVLYDVGNSAFTLLVSTLLPIFFNTIAAGAGVSDSEYLAWWAYATSISTAIVAVLGPTLGTLSDLRGVRKKIFSVSILVGALGCAVLGFVQHWIWFLVLFVLAKSAYQLSLVVYDSMLCDVSARERMDEVSSRGYAWGYIGSCIPFILTIVVYVLYEMVGVLDLMPATVLVFLIVAVWWVACSFPLWKNYEQKHCVEPGAHPVRTGFKNLGGIFRELGRNKRILFFLLAFFFFIDGVYTIIDMATAYGTSLGLDTVSLVIALLVTQIVAFPAAILLGMLSRKVKSEYLIIASIIAYFFITVYAVFLDREYEFWILAVCVGLFQGTIQAMSRSYYAKIIPHEKAGEYFGVYDIFGKGAAFMGSLLVGGVTSLFTPYFEQLASEGVQTSLTAQSIGVAALSVMFLVGLAFFIVAIRSKAPASSAKVDGAEPAEEKTVAEVACAQAAEPNASADAAEGALPAQAASVSAAGEPAAPPADFSAE